MKQKTIQITYQEYSSIDELSAEDKALCLAAIDAMKGSYAPYSHFNVGAAVRLSDGTIFKGANQENAAYPSGLCAERTAMFAASAHHPDKDIVSLAVAGGPDGTIGEDPASPCGACRQVMAQYQKKSGQNLSIILIGSKSVQKFEKVEDLLPFIFTALD